MSDDLNVDEFLERFSTHESNSYSVKSSILSRSEFLSLVDRAKQILMSQPVMLELMPPLTICGDVHGQFRDVIRLFEKGGYPDITNYLFLGDYVDRGPSSVNTISLLLCYKVKYPLNFFMLRGNHEISSTNRTFGFYDELAQTFSDHDEVFRRVNEAFDWLPMTALIDGRVLCIHGGISPRLSNLGQLRNLVRPIKFDENTLALDLLWSDPGVRVDDWDENERGVSCLYGSKSLRKFLDDNNLDVLVRAHQVVEDGYEFPFSPYMGVVTVFSAPKYCDAYDNKAALMHIDENLEAYFSVIEPISSEPQVVEKTKKKKQSSFKKIFKKAH